MADTVQWILNYPEVTIIILTGVLQLAKDFVGEIKGFFKLEEGTEEHVNLFATKKAIKPKQMDDDTPFMFQVLFSEHCIADDDGRDAEFDTPASSAHGTGMYRLGCVYRPELVRLARRDYEAGRRCD